MIRRLHKGLHHSTVNELLRLTLLAPELVEAILNGRQPEGVTLPALLEGVPVGWGEQRLVIGVLGAASAHSTD